MVIPPHQTDNSAKPLIVECLVTFLTGDEGGRTTPPRGNGNRYRPWIQVQKEGAPELFGVMFYVGPSIIALGVEVAVELLLVVYPSVSYDALQAGVSFFICEGQKIVGTGHIVRRRMD